MPTALPLAEAFSRSLAPGLEGRFGTGTELNEALMKLVADARTAWPALEVDEVSFAEHLGQRLQADSTLSTVHAADLYLAFACVLGDPAAMEAFDRTVLSRLPASLRGTLPAGMTSDDVLQSLRLKLFVRQGEAPPAICGYSGRGALVHWLRAAAVRVTQDFARRRSLEVATPDEAMVDTPAVGNDADVTYLKSRYGPEFKAAFQEALAALSPRDQNLLRLQYLDGISPEEIGRIYQTHRTTVWRWLTQCREQLLARTRTLLAARVQVGEGELSSLMNAVHSQLDVSLSRMLPRQ